MPNAIHPDAVFNHDLPIPWTKQGHEVHVVVIVLATRLKRWFYVQGERVSYALYALLATISLRPRALWIMTGEWTVPVGEVLAHFCRRNPQLLECRLHVLNALPSFVMERLVHDAVRNQLRRLDLRVSCQGQRFAPWLHALLHGSRLEDLTLVLTGIGAPFGAVDMQRAVRTHFTSGGNPLRWLRIMLLLF